MGAEGRVTTHNKKPMLLARASAGSCRHFIPFSHTTVLQDKDCYCPDSAEGDTKVREV